MGKEVGTGGRETRAKEIDPIVAMRAGPQGDWSTHRRCLRLCPRVYVSGQGANARGPRSNSVRRDMGRRHAGR